MKKSDSKERPVYRWVGEPAELKPMVSPRTFGFSGVGRSTNYSKWIKAILDKGNTPVLIYDIINRNADSTEKAKETCRLFKEEFEKEIDFDDLVSGVMFFYKKC